MENKVENKKAEYETLFNENVEGKLIKVQLETGEFNGYPYSRYIVEESSLMDNGQPFTKMIKGEDGQTYFVPDVKRSSMNAKTFDLLRKIIASKE